MPSSFVSFVCRTLRQSDRNEIEINSFATSLSCMAPPQKKKKVVGAGENISAKKEKENDAGSSSTATTGETSDSGVELVQERFTQLTVKDSIEVSSCPSNQWKLSSCLYSTSCHQRKVSENYLNKYELACVLGTRTTQIANGCAPTIDVCLTGADNEATAHKKMPSYLSPRANTCSGFLEQYANCTSDALSIADAEFLLGRMPFQLRRYLCQGTNNAPFGSFEDWNVNGIETSTSAMNRV